MTVNRPRLILVTRKTQLELLLERHGTLGQARFYLESRGQAHVWQEAATAHARFEAGLAAVQRAIPSDERRVRIDRTDLPTFLFWPDDVVVVVGQDGLVPNVAKYLAGQLTIGVNPDPQRIDGVLCPHRPEAVPRLLDWLVQPEPSYQVQRRTMAVVEREDGQRLLGLNEVFVGHRTHQSARYSLRVGGRQERQSSSGLICATGTGSSGWLRSIARQRHLDVKLSVDAARLAWVVREPFPSVSTGTDLDFGLLGPDESLEIVSDMGEDGTIFADGIEADRLEFVAGQVVRVGLAAERLNLVMPSSAR